MGVEAVRGLTTYLLGYHNRMTSGNWRNGFVVRKMEPSVLIKADVGAAFGVHSHSTGGVQCDPQPAQLLAEVHGESVVGVAARSECQEFRRGALHTNI